MNPLTRFFSIEKRAARLEKTLQRAIATGDQEKARSAFSKAFLLLVGGENAGLLSDLVLSYPPQAASASGPGGPVPRDARWEKSLES